MKTLLKTDHSTNHRYTSTDHTFVVCAYGQSPFIEACICSVLDQSVKSKVIICTSTPSDYLSKMAEKYNLKLWVNEKAEKHSDIALDWNYAISVADTDLVTIAHQDDLYKHEYVEDVLNYMNLSSDPIISFTDYAELRNDQEVSDVKLLKIKRVMLIPLRLKFLWHSRRIRRMILAFGSPICCPSVTYVKSKLSMPFFLSGYKGGIDWQAWERFSKLRGDFVFIPHIDMVHRIHESSETSSLIKSDTRSKEDYAMFCKFWPPFIAKAIVFLYKRSENSNKID